MTQTHTGPRVSTTERRALASRLGVDASTADPVTWDVLADELDGEHDRALVSMGEAIRDDLAGRLDDDLLERTRRELEAEFDRLPAVREAGIPDGPGGLYEEVAEPGWRLYDHFVDVGLFESLDEKLPRFTAEHVERSTRGLVSMEPLSASLTDVGFDEEEKTWLLVSVATNNERLARWVPTNQIPADVEFDVSNVPPLHQRAMGGVLLWIRGLDRHLWGYEPLVTEAILDDAVWYTKAMLGGLYVVTTAAHDLATTGAFTDGQLSAAFTAGAAIEVVSQEDLLRDVFYITDDMRAPSELR